MVDWFQEWMSQLNSDFLVSFSQDVIVAILILIGGRWLAKALISLLRKTLTHHSLDPLLIDFTTRILYVALLLVVTLSAVAYLGIDITPLVVLLGGSALAIGLALQSSLSNFASGLMLVAFRPFTQGHYVEAGGVGGTVTKVGIFNTELVTPDNRQVIVPNSTITNSTITNYSAHETRRIDLVIGVHYDDNLKIAQRTLFDVLNKHPKVLDDPKPTVSVIDLADSSINIAVRPWVRSEDYWMVRAELLEEIKHSLEQAGCTIPYPQRTFYLHSSSSKDPNS